jgi:hypothetical protein
MKQDECELSKAGLVLREGTSEIAWALEPGL